MSQTLLASNSLYDYRVTAVDAATKRIYVPLVEKKEIIEEDEVPTEEASDFDEDFSKYAGRINTYIEPDKNITSSKLSNISMDPLFTKIAAKSDEGGFNGLLVKFLPKNKEGNFVVSTYSSEDAFLDKLNLEEPREHRFNFDLDNLRQTSKKLSFTYSVNDEPEPMTEHKRFSFINNEDQFDQDELQEEIIDYGYQDFADPGAEDYHIHQAEDFVEESEMDSMAAPKISTEFEVVADDVPIQPFEDNFVFWSYLRTNVPS